jgi:tetratricopeptide (TPR) repeat protein
VRKSPKHPPRKIQLTGLLFLVIGILFSGCHKTIQITVSTQDILRANETAKEGDTAFGRRDFYAALIKYIESARLNPNNEYVCNKLGITYSQLAVSMKRKDAAEQLPQYYEQAKAAFFRSIELNPKYPYSYNNLGSVFFAQKNLKKAEKYFKKAISLKEDEASFHMNLGSLYMERKRREKGMAEWHRGLALDPNVLSKNVSVSLLGDPAALMIREYDMSRLLASSGDVPAAIKHLELAINHGFTDIDSIKKEPDFDRIREDQRFVDFIENAGLLIKLRLKVGLPEEPKK